MDLRWLTANDREVATAMAQWRRSSRPTWVPTRRQFLLHVNNCLLLWYLCIVFMVFGVHVDEIENHHLTLADLPGFLTTMAIAAAWVVGAVFIFRWSKQPPAPRARLAQWRQELTARANGFDPKPSSLATFSSILGNRSETMHEFPRFVSDGVEFGNLTPSYVPHAKPWAYVSFSLPAPLPHLVLDASPHTGVGSDLPLAVDRQQKIALEGDFNSRFTVYAPGSYEKDALYVLTPDVMSDLVDHAAWFNVEIIDNTVVFFARPEADFSKVETWNAIFGILHSLVPRFRATAQHYRDDRVEGQNSSPTIDAVRAALANPGVAYVPPTPHIDPDGRRLAFHYRRGAAIRLFGLIGWVLLLIFLYAVPGIFAFAGFMSIVDGR